MQTARKKSSKGGIVERFAAIYPGTKHAGICLAILRNGEIIKMAVGSIPMSAILSTVEQFNVDCVVIESYRDAAICAGIFHLPEDTTLYRLHPSWNNESKSLPPEWRHKPGALGKNAWRMMFAFIRRNNFYIGNVRPVRYSTTWLKENRGTR